MCVCYAKSLSLLCLLVNSLLLYVRFMLSVTNSLHCHPRLFDFATTENCTKMRFRVFLVFRVVSALPHKTKIFVAGNHETNFPRHCREHIASLLAPSCIYLQDASVTVSGIRFYGSPWNGLRHNSAARAFSVLYSSLPTRWQRIPENTDVLVTHNPAFGVADLASNKHPFNVTRYCDLCRDHHKEFRHFGCASLLDQVLHRVRQVSCTAKVS